MRMSILLYDGFTTLDIVGGYESLACILELSSGNSGISELTSETGP